ncbi:uncharacterized protein LOC111020930 [Momordica charantia]|uniref:Uncharacterized protein LOC111020930 n=1 Tax=Momordica charantia TaxID=3673 RepID=A0A6J1DKL2_MOMCH|nr:uncharacterized protein LOC111020930 [Momordica charantia]
MSSHVSIQPQTPKIDPDLQTQEQISRSIINDYLAPFPSKFEDLRVRSLRRSRNSHCYIKCQDLDQTPELSGERCFLCKRDLSFKPEGSLVLPKILPAVAVLPCRHVFHDLCLERITPQDQSEDPPCIPCAVGET